MTRAEMRTFLTQRFDNTSSVGQTVLNHLIAAAEGRIWSEARWRFKMLRGEQLVVAQDATQTALPASVALVDVLFDDLGDELVEYDPDRFEAHFRVDLLNNVRDRPSAYVMGDDGKGVLNVNWNRVNDTQRTFRYNGEKKLHHLDTGVVTLGPMDEDGDSPVWDAEYHLLVCYEAALAGLIVENDPSYAPVAALRDEAMAAMIEQYAEPSPRIHFPRRRP